MFAFIQDLDKVMLIYSECPHSLLSNLSLLKFITVTIYLTLFLNNILIKTFGRKKLMLMVLFESINKVIFL